MGILKKIKKGKVFLIAFILSIVTILPAVPANAAGELGLKAGVYKLDAKLNCYVNAMGGVEFGEPLLTDAQLEIDEGGNAALTLSFTKSSVTIYSVTCDTFIDPAPEFVTEDRGVASGTIGYYDQSGVLQTEGVSYTQSEDTAPNPSNVEVHYVDSITFPLNFKSDSYSLTMYINSNVMGVQFCNANDSATAATYPAALTVDWDSISAVSAENSGMDTDTNESADAEAVNTETASTDASGTEAPATAAAAEGDHVSADATEDGLNIYYVDNESKESEESNRAYETINSTVMVVLLIIAAVIIIIGIILVVVTGKAKKKQ